IVVIDRSTDNFWPEKMVSLSPYYPVYQKRREFGTLPESLNKNIAFILGSLLAEGYLSDKKLEFCNTDKEWVDKLLQVWNNCFDSTLHCFKKNPSSYGKLPYYRLECHTLDTISFLNNIGLVSTKSENRRIPKLILKSPKSTVVEFLRAYFEGDGTITFSPADKPHMIELGCCSKSKELMKDMQVLLLRFGIDATRRFDKHKNVWKLYLRGYRNALRFYKEIGFLSEHKNKKLEYVVHSYQKSISRTDYVPFISDYIHGKTDDTFTHKNNFDRYNTMQSNYQQVCSSVLQTTGVDCSSMFEYFLTYTYLFDQVTQIQDAGIQNVYSIKVESDCHSFISNGFISHNTEAKLKKLAEELLQDIEKDTVAWGPNFDDSLKEPIVLPCKVPNLLINGSSGIAVGMATNIPPHNLKEVCSGVVKLIDNPEIEIAELMETITAPDFPTGGIICGTNGVKQAYLKGRGKLVIRSKTHIEEVRKDKKAIIVTEIPYQVNKSTLIEEIANKVKDKVITGISDIRDESDREGMRIVIELKGSSDPAVVENQLFSHTRMQTTFGVIMLALDEEKQPKVMPLKEMLVKFKDHRMEIVTRRSAYDLRKAEERSHILAGLIIALDNIDPVVQLIKKASSAEVAREGLMSQYSLSEKQAKAILEMRLQRLTSMEQDKIRDEQKQLQIKIADLKDILSSEPRRLNIIKGEMSSIIETYGDERRTSISMDEVEGFDLEELIKPEDMVVTLSHAGYVKHLPVTTYREQKRGGRGVAGAKTREEDFIEHLFTANTHSYILFFTNKGKVKWMKVYQLPQASRTARGTNLVNLLALDKDERVQAFVPVKEFKDSHYVFFATKQGVAKRTPLKDFSRPRKGGIIALGLRDGDELVNVVVTNGKQNILIATKNGLAIKFKEDDVRPMGRTATGVRGIKLKPGDEVVGMIKAEPNTDVFTLCENGFGKRTSEDDYRVINRGGMGVINIKITEKNGKVVAVKPVTNETSIMMISRKGIIIRTSANNISTIGRNTQGVRVMRLDAEDQAVTAALVVTDDRETTEEIEEEVEESKE
ncbi:MAG: DNA gyrase subunit A, partial [Candidatus Nanoarchaeia archaeon]